MKTKVIGCFLPSLITYEKPSLYALDLSQLILQIGALRTLKAEGSFLEPVIEVLPITDARLKLCWEHDLYRIRIPITSQKVSLQIQ